VANHVLRNGRIVRPRAPVSDRAAYWLLMAGLFAVTFAALAIRSLWEMPQ
jgi:2-hydroxychromene-2-carboxylate isomerase